MIVTPIQLLLVANKWSSLYKINSPVQLANIIISPLYAFTYVYLYTEWDSRITAPMHTYGIQLAISKKDRPVHHSNNDITYHTLYQYQLVHKHGRLRL